MEVLEIHRFPELMDQCCDLINMEWPRSKMSRLRTLEMSCDDLPTCLVLVIGLEVIGHSKISPIPSMQLACFIESVVIHPAYRGKGLGKFLMTKTEDCVRSRGIETAYLSTLDQEGFYLKLGYTECEPVQIYGGYVKSRLNDSNKINTCNNFNIKAQCATTKTALTLSPSNLVPVPPPPPLPKTNPNTIKQTSRKIYMKKDLQL